VQERRFPVARQIGQLLLEHRDGIVLDSWATYWLGEIADTIDDRDDPAKRARVIAQFANSRSPTRQPNVEHLAGIEEIREKLAVLTHRVQREVMTFAPNGAHTEESLKAAQPLDMELLRRGVRMRTVYLDSVCNSPHTVAYAEWLAERGGEVRTVPSLPVRMVIVDRDTAVIPVEAEDARQAAVVLTGHGTLTALCALFESVWMSAVGLGDVQKRDDSGLSAQERDVLDFLYRGLTDDAIAKRLGVSPRTSRRVANDMMERLGARSRFQAGALAVQHGWLPEIAALWRGPSEPRDRSR
jgi:DNA-binding CsgD family transcriptional regulator